MADSKTKKDISLEDLKKSFPDSVEITERPGGSFHNETANKLPGENFVGVVVTERPGGSFHNETANKLPGENFVGVVVTEHPGGTFHKMSDKVTTKKK